MDLIIGVYAPKPLDNIQMIVPRLNVYATITHYILYYLIMNFIGVTLMKGSIDAARHQITKTDHYLTYHMYPFFKPKLGLCMELFPTNASVEYGHYRDKFTNLANNLDKFTSSFYWGFAE